MLGSYQPLTMWNVVHPSNWFPMASLEQSLMELANYPVQTYCIMEVLPVSTDDDTDEFFRDLPVVAQGAPEAKDVAADPNEANAAQSFSYSYSSTSVAGDDGCVVQSIRRRYEDANGRLKAVHERRLPGKELVTTWQKASKDDDGHQHVECSGGTTKDEFEDEWKKTPFAKAHESASSLEGDKKQALGSGDMGGSAGEKSKSSERSGNCGSPKATNSNAGEDVGREQANEKSCEPQDAPEGKSPEQQGKELLSEIPDVTTLA